MCIFIALLFFVFTDIGLVVFDNLREFNASVDYRQQYRFYGSVLYGFFSVVISRIGFSIAKKKNKDPWKWAKYCFFFNLFGLLLLLVDDENSEDL